MASLLAASISSSRSWEPDGGERAPGLERRQSRGHGQWEARLSFPESHFQSLPHPPLLLVLFPDTFVKGLAWLDGVSLKGSIT